jgi:transcriptional regulator with XRE-family HTH domain
MSTTPSAPRKAKAPEESLTAQQRMAFGARLRQERVAKGLSQAQLAEASGIGKTYISQIENAAMGRGRSHNLTLETAAALTGPLGFRVDIFWEPLHPTRRRK